MDDFPSYYDLITYRNSVQQLYSLLQDLADRLQQVTLEFPTSGPRKRHDLSDRITESVNRIADARAFIMEIALTRLEEMKVRAERGVELLQEMEKRKVNLQKHIDSITNNGWRDPSSNLNSYYYFPSLDELIENWIPGYEWIDREARDIRRIFASRSFEFDYRRYESTILDDWPDWDIIWSRWALTDMRTDPEGKEAFCWRDRGES